MKKEKPIIPIVAALVVQLCVGIIYLWSVFKGNIITAFGCSASAAGMVSSYMMFAFVFGNLIGGFLNDKKGPKLTCFAGIILFALGVGLTALVNAESFGLIYVTYAVLGGLGSGFAYGACISCIQKWLPHRRGLASGLACGAFGFSTVVFTPVSNALMNAFTENGVVNFTPVFLILAIVFAVVGLIAAFFIKLPSEDYIKSLNLPAKAVANTINFTLVQAMKKPAFWCLFFSIFFINGTWNLAVPMIKDLGVARGLTEAAAVLCVTCTGIANAGGRIIMSTLSDKLGRTNTMYILCGMTCLGAILTTFITGYGYFIAILIIAFAFGGPSSLNAALCTDLFGPKNSGTNYGVAMLALGLSSIFFNWVSGTFLNGNVTSTFIMGAVTAVIPVFLMIYINNYLKKRATAE